MLYTVMLIQDAVIMHRCSRKMWSLINDMINLKLSAPSILRALWQKFHFKSWLDIKHTANIHQNLWNGCSFQKLRRERYKFLLSRRLVSGSLVAFSPRYLSSKHWRSISQAINLIRTLWLSLSVISPVIFPDDNHHRRWRTNLKLVSWCSL